MATFDVKISSIKNEADDFDKMAKKLEKHYDSISDIKKSLSGVLGSSGASIGNSLGTVMSQIQSEQKSCAAISNSLESIAQTYTNAEKALVPGYDAGTVKDAQSGDAQGGDDPSFWDGFLGNFGSNLRDKAVEYAGPIMTQTAAGVNLATATARGPKGPNSFVIVNTNVTAKTSKVMQFAAKHGGKFKVGAQYGLPVLGAVLDYASMRSSGVGKGEAANKAILHTGVGLAGGFAGSKIGAAIGTAIPVPVVGTVVGAVVGFVAGVAITTVGNMIVDYVYDNWDDITETAKEIGTAVVDGAKAAGKAVVDGAKCIAEGIGNAASSVGKFWGTVFG